MSISLGNIISFVSLVGNVMKTTETGASFIQLFSSQEPSVQTLLQQVDVDIVKGFSDLVSELNQQEYQEKWSAINQTIDHIHTQRKSYAKIFSTATLDANGNYVVTDDKGNQVHFLDWALGPDESGDGTLGDMYAWLNDGEIHNQSLSSLYGIFQESGSDTDADAGTYGHSAIGLFLQILNSAQTFSGGTLSSTYSTDLQVNSLYRFQEAIFKLTVAVYYTHEAMREFIKQITGHYQGTASAYGLMQTNFGDYGTGGTVWNLFATAIQGLYQQGQGPDQQLLTTAYNGGNVPADKVQPMIWSNAINANDGPESFRWCPYAFSLSDYYSNAYFSSIGFVQLTPPIQPAIWPGYVFVGLQGMVTQVSAGSAGSTTPVFSPMSDPVPPMSDLNASTQWIPSSSYQNLDKYTGSFQMTTWNSGYAPAPIVSDVTTQIPVITGFQLSVIDNGGAFNLVILLQFGVLDLSTPASPTVTVSDTTYYAPAWTGQQGTQMCLNGNFIGNLGGVSHQSRNTGILTNVSLDRQSSGANCINVQLYPSIYALNAFQPDQVPQVAPPSPPPSSNPPPSGN